MALEQIHKKLERGSSLNRDDFSSLEEAYKRMIKELGNQKPSRKD